MNCVILQPSYIPWRGYFHQIYKADLFIFFDDVQYDTGGWRNRNRVKTAGGTQWLTVPVHSQGAEALQRPTNSIEICWDRRWNAKHLAVIENAYRTAPYYKQYAPLLRSWYQQRPQLLADFTIQLTMDLSRELGIRSTKFMRSSTLSVEGAKTERLVSILKQVGADHYICGPAAKAYMDEALLNSHGITLEWMEYHYPEYPQLYPPFDPQVSVMDLLMMTGPDAGSYIWGNSAV